MLHKETKRRSAINDPETLQETFKRTYEGQTRMNSENVYIQTGDEKFLSELVEYIKQNISNPNLSVETLSRDMKMSRVWLYKKLLMLSGKSPVEFIRAIRLQKAIQLLENTQMKISRVASEVGFETPQHFSKLFKNEYDILPSAYVRFARMAKAQKILKAYGLAGTIKKADFNNQSTDNKSQNLIFK
ncbi:AraC family transcriptional regulator [Mucilaginibacter sp. BJC16-A38]|uniref:helix-turn-helix domain-containing protein n=1 Tax=Mucilaginibacter phenanthrenivorans TaxID=1234842 RepID=UPI0021576A18|nr:AraC family transcriptional regulator [Mucilaginibacter phenanthrenivorans]MCR8557215.1 AraC family transcriptional regulator [Mucilaginibacter phenanthrenivorans]